ncbi:hypothetical protein Dimus_015977 [Dionaea muscipula]
MEIVFKRVQGLYGAMTNKFKAEILGADTTDSEATQDQELEPTEKAKIEDLKSNNVRISEKVEKEKAMLRISDAALREERAQLKLPEAKQKLIEAFLRRKEEARVDLRLDGDLIGHEIDFCGKEEGDNGSIDGRVDCLRLYKDEFHKRSSSTSRCLVPWNSKNQSTDEELKG